MLTKWASALALGLISVATAGCQTGSPANAASSQALTPVTITTSGASHVFRVELARTEAEQERGLMYRPSVPADGGMLFPFAIPRVASFWMKNTQVPLDMLFIRTDGSIARIAANTVPLSLTPVTAGEPVGAVLEIAGGRAAELGIEEGDKVAWTQ